MKKRLIRLALAILLLAGTNSVADMKRATVRTRMAEQLGSVFFASGSATNTNLNSAFVQGSSGACLGIRFYAPEAQPIDAVYAFIGSSAGTWSNITLQCTINNEGSVQARPGTTVRATSTSTVMPDSAGKWVKFVFGSPYTPAVGEILWALITNTSSNPTVDYPGIRTNQSTDSTTDNFNNPLLKGYSTGNGYTTDGSQLVRCTAMIQQNGVITLAQPFTNRGNCFASNLLERGIKITPKQDCEVFAVFSEAPTTSFVKVRILAEGTAPGGTALYEYDWVNTNSTADLIGAFLFPSPIALTGGTTYLVTFTYTGGTSSVPGSQAVIEDYSSYSTVFDSFLDSERHKYPIMIVNNGSGGWTEYKNYTGGIGLGVYQYTTTSGSGGAPRFGDRTGGK